MTCDTVCRLSKVDGSGAVWPDHIVDVKQAIVWIKDNIAQYGGDPDCIVIAGGTMLSCCRLMKIVVVMCEIIYVRTISSYF